jgi:hypothetical protein
MLTFAQLKKIVVIVMAAASGSWIHRDSANLSGAVPRHCPTEDSQKIHD